MVGEMAGGAAGTSGDAALEHVGLKTSAAASFHCPECRQIFQQTEALDAHRRFTHSPNVDIEEQRDADPELWRPPASKVSGRRSRDFARFAELQSALKSSCCSLHHFVRRDFEALANGVGAYDPLCRNLDAGKVAETINKFAPRADSLAKRIEAREKLRIVFIGPVKAGKSTLINVLLSTHLGSCEMLLPVDSLAATNCIWKVESCDGDTASVYLEGRMLKTWACGDPASVAGIRQEIALYLEDNLDRQANPENRSEVLVKIPLAMLDPFGCHYCLVDTPGFTESEEYEGIVTKFLQDHSHIACMVCPLTEGTAMPQSTRGMMQKSYSKTFWVLTRYDELLTRRAKRGETRRQTADRVAEKFKEEIGNVDPRAQVFLHAAQVLMPEDAEEDWNTATFKDLPEAEARDWFGAIKAHVQDCFLAIQQEQHVLSSQSRQCVDFASDVLQEYTHLKDGSQGTLVASEYYAKELQTGTEEAANLLEREIRQEIETVKGSVLEKLGEDASARVKAEQKKRTVMQQQAYYDALVATLLPSLEAELQRRLDIVVKRAQQRVFDLARRLLQEAGMDEHGSAAGSNKHDIFKPDSSHLRARYPVESVATLSLCATAVGATALSETGTALLAGLGLRLGAMSVVGVVGFTVVSIATIGLSVKKLTEIHPFWSYATVNKDVIEKMRQANQWGMLAEASSGRARAQLLSGVSQFRYAFSELLLTRGTPRDVLVSIFPDLPLFESIHKDLHKVCTDIREFVDAPDLAARAELDVERCVSYAVEAAWAQVIAATSDYLSPNARTDAVRGEALARLLQMRCEALLESDAFGEARHTAEVFHTLFPELALPLVYSTAAQIRFDSLAGTLDMRAAQEQVKTCDALLRDQNDQREVPLRAEVWFYGVVVSFLTGCARQEVVPSLVAAIRELVGLRMGARPSWKAIAENCTRQLRANFAARGKELSGEMVTALRDIGRLMEPTPEQEPLVIVDSAYLADEDDGVADMKREIQQTYMEQCNSYAARAAQGIHGALADLSPAHVDIHIVGIHMVQAILKEVRHQVTREPALENSVYDDIKSRLCVSEASGTARPCEEWMRLFCEIGSYESLQSALQPCGKTFPPCGKTFPQGVE